MKIIKGISASFIACFNLTRAVRAGQEIMITIALENVSIAFGPKQVLKGCSLEIRQGETMTIIGGSGSGKSVMLKLILGLIPADEGHIFFKGKDLTSLTEKEFIAMRAKIGMLFQGAALFDSLTVYENVAYPIREHFDYSEEKIDKIVDEKLALVGLSESKFLYPEDLSGGMKKRIGLARAIASDPEVILYDEPTTGLDPTNTRRINELILHLQKVLKVTSIVVTHDMASAFAVSDRLALLSDKKIEFVGTVDEVKNSKNSTVADFIHGEIGEAK